MNSRMARLSVFSAVLFGLSAVAMAGSPAPPLVNWTAPATYRPAGAPKIHTLNDISQPVPFIEIVPCRQYNSTSPSDPLLQGVNRSVTLRGSPCGIPLSAAAVSVNITVFNITGATGNGVFKVDIFSPPRVAWINYPPTEKQRANAGTVALDASGQIVVQVAQGAGQVDFIVDVNGYYAEDFGTPLNPGEYFEINGSEDQVGIIIGRNASNNFGIGVEGVETASSGIVYGVSGECDSLSNDTAGVYGRSASIVRPLNAYDLAGVRGESDTHTGVLGVSEFQGVAGSVIDPNGNEQAYGVVGFNPGSVYGVFSGGDLGASGAKLFVEPHPTDASKVIRYVSLEGRESGTYFRGSAQVVDGTAVIDVPEDFRIVTDVEGLTVQLTPVGELATMAVVTEDLDQIVVKSSRDVRFHYMVNGVRRAFKDHQAIGEGTEFMPHSPTDRMPGYLTEEARRRLIANGTYNADGTVNLATAQRLGWTRIWANREAQARTAAVDARKAAGPNQSLR